MFSYDKETNTVKIKAFPISDHLNFESAETPYPLTTFNFGHGVYHTTSLYETNDITYYYPMTSLFMTAFRIRQSQEDSVIIKYYKRLAYMLILIGEKTICLA